MTATKMIQLKRIAEEASVSIATVSRVLARKEQVAAKTRERVMRVAEKLNYRPNRLVHALQSGRTNTVGVMINPASEYHACILGGIEEIMVQADYLPVMVTGKQHGDEYVAPVNELDLIHRLVEQRVDGIIICPIEDATPDEALQEAWKHRLPVICVDRAMPNTHAGFVGTDDRLGGQLAAEHLIKLGHCCIGHLAGPGYSSTGRLRREGFEKAVKDAGVDFVIQENNAFNHGVEQAIALLNATPRPTAIFAASDKLAMGVYRAASQMGLNIPDDLSVLGFADLAFASMVTPTLTTMRQDPRQIGQRAARLMLQSIADKRSDPQSQTISIKPQLVERESTARLQSN
jgi:DNA-binding LacI/PurR family transcriptional regulator